MGAILDTINSPADLKRLKPEEVQRLIAEVRERIREVVSVNRGHLASNLGVVELTTAIHRVFNVPVDTLLFDVGHQVYAHKLYTGRRERFHTLRKLDGISGFPNPKESAYDAFLAGHAGTSISAALGVAVAKGMKDDRSKTIAVIGDGSLGSGLSFEGLNQAGHLKKNLLIILNDNEMAIAKTVGAFSSYLTRLRSVPLYLELRKDVAKLIDKIPLIGAPIENAIEKALATVKDNIMPGHIFREFGFKYYGPINGHDYAALENTLVDIKEIEQPVLLHVITEKGRGFEPAAKDPETFHSAPSFTMGANGIEKAASGTSYSSVLSVALLDEAAADRDVVAITAAMSKGTGISKVRESFPDRCFDVGIAEQHALTFAGGLARGGLKPVVAIYSTFLQRGYDQFFHDLCLQGDLGAAVVIDRAGLVGADGPTHHGAYDIAYLRHLPNAVLMAPKDAEELKMMLAFALTQKQIVAIRYPKENIPAADAFSTHEPIALGKSEILTEGRDVAIITYGAMVVRAQDAARALEAKGISATLVNARFAKPLDRELLRTLAGGHKLLVTVEDHALAGGFGSAVLECLNEMKEARAAVLRLGIPDEFIEHGTRDELFKKLGIDKDGIAAAIVKALGK